MKTILFLLAFILLPLVVHADDKVKVGDQSITIPYPEGFVRFDGNNADVDKIMQSMLPPSNRSLMVVATPADAAKAKAGKPGNLDRFMNIQTLRAAEGEKISLADFKTISGQLEKQFTPDGGGIGNIEDEVNKRIKEAKLGVDLKLGETKLLGVFDKTDRSVDMGMMMKTKLGDAAPETMAAGMSFVVVHGKVLFLYVYANFKNADDITWTRNTVKAWRQAIHAANPE